MDDSAGIPGEAGLGDRREDPPGPPPLHADEAPSVTILVTGGSGVLGHALAKTFPEADRPSRRELDLTDEHSVRAYNSAPRPAPLVHTAALPAIRKCEADRGAGRGADRDGAGHL